MTSWVATPSPWPTSCAASCARPAAPSSAKAPPTQQFVVLDNAQVEALAERVRFSTWEKLGDGRTVIRLVTSWSTTPDDLAALKAALHEVL